MDKKQKTINLQVTPEKRSLSSNGLSFEVLTSGDIYSIQYEWLTLNMYRATTLDGMMANIYLRITKGEDVYYTKLLGVDSPSEFQISNSQMIYRGCFMEVNYTVHFKLIEYTWFWEVELESDNKDLLVELFYGQDVSLNSPHANQAYVCQYLDHRPYEENNAFHVITKQNEGAPLLLQQGSLTPNISYATDGFDFFGKSYKLTNKIEALVKGNLPSRNYQYELAYISFQTPKRTLHNKYQAIFYASFTSNYKNKREHAISIATLWEKYRSIEDAPESTYQKLKKVELDILYQDTLAFTPFTTCEIEQYYPDRILEEIDQGLHLSWFSSKYSHFMNGLKEAMLERPQGTILMNLGTVTPDQVMMASTNYIFGVFQSQIVLGNSQFNRLLTINKTPLNILKTSGMRLFIRTHNRYQLLTMPALYSMYVNTTSWMYKINDDIIAIRVGISASEHKIMMDVQSKQKQKYQFLLTSEVVLNDVEHIHPLEVEVMGNTIKYHLPKDSLTHKYYPEYSYTSVIETSSRFEVNDDRIFYHDKESRNNPILTIEIFDTDYFSYQIYGNTNGSHYTNQTLEEINQEYYQAYQKAQCNFHLSFAQDNANAHEIQKFNAIVPWYMHNALIHYANPHGLEQYGGGAWGTRDVLQGPVELFASINRFDLVRSIILKVYSRQFEETGDWPQWFMFDRFKHIQADSSHGDIIVWPLYAISNYLLNTGDTSILQEKVPYISLATGKNTSAETIMQHIEKQLTTIQKSFIKGTHLASYGGGDWDDTLQPANREATKYMVSSWTISLIIQAIETLASFVQDSKIKELVSAINKDYQKYFIIDNVPAGFIQIKDNVTPIVHPSDTVTGIKYRLISFNQGMIAGLFTTEQVNEYLNLIDRYLMYPDGAHLMDTTVKYQGGTPKIFMRAETATNFGREISLNYIHAHIRYLEAMSIIGESERLFKGLKVINPILISENVPNALTRQSNLYFSSSDGNFINRYEADKGFAKLKTNEVQVKGGWRLYSSGPGIYLHQLISNFLGVKALRGCLYLDPVLPKSLDGLLFEYQYQNKKLSITYEIKKGKGIDYILVNGKKLSINASTNPYRQNGVIVPDSLLEENNKIIIRM